MPYLSVDILQKALSDNVFQNRQDSKKAAGRALGTLVELITFYAIREWKLLPHLSIERGLAEFANDEITHNVEFGLHPLIAEGCLSMDVDLPLSITKVVRAMREDSKLRNLAVESKSSNKSAQLLSSSGILRNACTISDTTEHLVIANLRHIDAMSAQVDIAKLRLQPFAMVECKRVGVEDGAKKGPTTIEKAKQGAYVAKHVSALQKVRGRDGKLYGVMPMGGDKFEIRELVSELRRLIYDADADELEGFILTVGVVSNHGNWFTADDPNKELLVLKQSYDWLLFLTDAAISEFVTDTILSSSSQMAPVKKAFAASYDSGESGKNQFTKVRIALDAHRALTEYFHENIDDIEQRWFNVLSPRGCNISELKTELWTLARKF